MKQKHASLSSLHTIFIEVFVTNKAQEIQLRKREWWRNQFRVQHLESIVLFEIRVSL